jgi:hypothetical protein
MEMELDKDIFTSLRAIHWFSKCAEAPDETLGFEAIWIPDWATATKSFTNPEWENTTLEARNALTTHFATKHAPAYQDWNRLVRESKPKLEDTVFASARRFQEENGLNQTFFNCVQWDVLGIVMEVTFKSCRPPLFFAKLLTIYSHGRFPCGWKGEWPNGQLMVI